jgi:hypothetical protein
MGILALVRLLGSAFRSIRNGLNGAGRGAWPAVEAIVTADPERRDGIAGSVVEIVYSYRFEGELYTGMHEEPVFPEDAEYQQRFISGRRFVVRVKPGEPEISVVRDKDQTDGLEKRLEQIRRQ